MSADEINYSILLKTDTLIIASLEIPKSRAILMVQTP